MESADLDALDAFLTDDIVRREGRNESNSCVESARERSKLCEENVCVRERGKKWKQVMCGE